MGRGRTPKSSVLHLNRIVPCPSPLPHRIISACSSVNLTKSNITPEKSVAELIVGSMINLLRKINSHDQNMKNNIWKKEMGNLLYGKKIGIIGFGKVGKYLHKILKNFGVKIFVSDIKKIKSLKNYSLDYLVTNCDIISVNINLVKNF